MSDRVSLPITEAQADDSEKKLQLEVDRLSAELTRQIHLNSSLKDEKSSLQQKLTAIEKQRTKAAYEEGLDAGYKAGIAKANETQEQCLLILRNVEEEVAGYSKVLQEKFVSIVLASLYKILGEHLISPDVALAAIRNVLSQAGHQENMTVRISPEHHKYINSLKPSLEPASKVRYIADDQVQLGGCIIEPDRGLLDGRIETQLKALEELLYESLSEPVHEHY